MPKRTSDRQKGQGVTTSIGGAAFLGMVGTAATLALSMVRSKTTALVLGPEGVGITAEILQVVTLAATPVAIFSGPALVSRLAAARAEGDQSKMESLYSSAFTLSAAVSVAAAILASIGGSYFLGSRLDTPIWSLVALAAVGSVGSTLAGIPTQVLTVEGRLSRLTRVGIMSAAIQTVLVVSGTLLFRLSGQFFALAIGPFVGLILVFAAIARDLPGFHWRPACMITRSFARDALVYGGTSLASAVGLQAALTVIRGVLDAKGGPVLNGQFQAAWSVGGTYFGFVLGGIGSFAFPRYAAATNAVALAKEVRDAFRFVMRIAPPTILVMIALRRPIVRILYSDRFSEAVPLMGLMMAGDLARALVWVQHGPLLYRGKLRAYLLVEAAGIGGLMAGSVVLVPRMGLVAVGWAYFVSYLFLMPISTIALLLSTGVTLGFRSVGLSIAAMLLLLAAAFVPMDFWPGRLATLAAAFTWAWRAGILRDVVRRVSLHRTLSGGRQ